MYFIYVLCGSGRDIFPHLSGFQFDPDGYFIGMERGMDTEQTVSTFKEEPAKQWSEESQKILEMRISELGLKLEDTCLEKLVEQLYKELDSAGILLKPRAYLSDEWGCPEGVPVISI